MDADPELAVIVPCHNAADTIGVQLDALSEQIWSGAWEVVVVDNRSTDGSAAVIRSRTPRLRHLRLVQANDGAGAAHARNVGARHTAARALAFCDADDVVSPGWVASIGEALRHHALVTGSLDLYALNDPVLATSRGVASATRLSEFGSVPFMRTNNGGVRRELFERLGGFDESFGGHEDIEFSLRAAALANECASFVPSAEVAYRYRPGLGALWRQGLFYGQSVPLLAERARSLGLPTVSRWLGLRSWAWLVLNCWRAVLPTSRGKVLWVVANRLGVLLGAFRVRRLYV